MKKRNLLFSLSLLFVSRIAHTQQAFKKGNNIVAAGIGLSSSILNYSGNSQTPDISL